MFLRVWERCFRIAKLKPLPSPLWLAHLPGLRCLDSPDVVQPDLVFVAKERLNIITKKNIVEAPDLVVEILSEHTETIDRRKKIELYEKYGVKEYWIVDPDAKVIEQIVRKKEKFVLHERVKNGQTLAAKIIEGLSFSVGEVFG